MAWRASYMLRLFPHILGNRDHHDNDDDDNEDDEDEDDGDDDATSLQGGGGGGSSAAPLQRHKTCAQESFSEQVLKTSPHQAS